MRPERLECQTSQIIRLGRHPDSDLVFVDDQVSRRHAEISPRGDEWVLHNLSTTNPILVDGLQLTGEMVLGARHTLTLGTTLLFAATVSTACVRTQSLDIAYTSSKFARSKFWE